VETSHRVVVLQHPREARRALGSVRILRRVLSNVVVRVGVELGDDPEVAAARADRGRDRVLLYPRASADRFDPATARGPLTVFVLDGTWSQARSLLAANPWLGDLPHIWLSPPRASAYGVCRQPFPWGLCTLEAVAQALAAVDRDDAIHDGLMRPLRAMAGMHRASIGTGAPPG
jgi:tRNA-uridine aminocarboxypropyltransferase